MECSDKNQLYIKKYESLISEKYKEPVEGRFEDATADQTWGEVLLKVLEYIEYL